MGSAPPRCRSGASARGRPTRAWVRRRSPRRFSCRRRRRLWSPSCSTLSCRWTTPLHILQPTIPLPAIKPAPVRPASRHCATARDGRGQTQPLTLQGHPIDFFHIDMAEVRRGSCVCMWPSTTRASSPSFSCTRGLRAGSPLTSCAPSVAAVPYTIHTVLTENGTEFVDSTPINEKAEAKADACSA